MVVAWKLGIGWTWQFQKHEWCRGVLEPLQYSNHGRSSEEVRAKDRLPNNVSKASGEIRCQRNVAARWARKS